MPQKCGVAISKASAKIVSRFMKPLTLLLIALTSVAAFPADSDDGFKPLFNGKDLTGWHLRRPDARNTWSVSDGVLKNTVNHGEHGVDPDFYVRRAYAVDEILPWDFIDHSHESGLCARPRSDRRRRVHSRSDCGSARKPGIPLSGAHPRHSAQRAFSIPDGYNCK